MVSVTELQQHQIWSRVSMHFRNRICTDCGLFCAAGRLRQHGSYRTQYGRVAAYDENVWRDHDSNLGESFSWVESTRSCSVDGRNINVLNRLDLITVDANRQRALNGFHRNHQRAISVARDQDSFDAIERTAANPYPLADLQK